MNPRQEGRRTQNKDYLKNENVPKNIDNFKNKWNSIWKFKKNSKMKMTQRRKTTLNHMARAYLTVVILVLKCTSCFLWIFFLVKITSFHLYFNWLMNPKLKYNTIWLIAHWQKSCKPSLLSWVWVWQWQQIYGIFAKHFPLIQSTLECWSFVQGKFTSRLNFNFFW